MIANASRAARAPRRFFASPGQRAAGHGTAASHDGRWPGIAQALADLREGGRHSVRILDVDCATGSLLIHAVRHARALGFTAIEGRGIDGAPALVARAQAAAGHLHDPAIGLSFEVRDLGEVLREEAGFPADILLWSGREAAFDPEPMLGALHRAAGRVFIDDALHGAGARQHA